MCGKIRLLCIKAHIYIWQGYPKVNPNWCIQDNWHSRPGCRRITRIRWWLFWWVMMPLGQRNLGNNQHDRKQGRWRKGGMMFSYNLTRNRDSLTPGHRTGSRPWATESSPLHSQAAINQIVKRASKELKFFSWKLKSFPCNQRAFFRAG